MPTAAIDPNAALALLRELVARTRSADTNRTDLGVLAKTLAEEIGALDTWLSVGGALPAAWERSRPRLRMRGKAYSEQIADQRPSIEGCRAILCAARSMNVAHTTIARRPSFAVIHSA